MTERRFDHINERDRETVFHKIIPSKFITDSQVQMDVGCVHSAIVCRPWLSKKVSIISANSGVTLASSRMSMMVSIELCSWSRQPESVHLVRCFEVSSLHLHCGYLLMAVFFQSESLELHPHHSDTCFVRYVRKGVGYPDMAQS